MKTTAEDLVSLIRAEFPDAAGAGWSAGTDPAEILGNSSLNLLYARSLILDNYGVTLSDDEIRNCRSLKELADIINTRG